VGFRKKGKYSACVGRQYLGCLGKEDNGQVAVVSALSSDTHYCPIDVELFMPEKWEEDSVRRSKAKIPAHVRHQTKPDMALRMIRSIKKKGIRFDYVNFDALYGSSFSVIKSLDEDNICFIGDIKDNIQISTEPICFTLPEKTVSSKGRKFKNKRADQPMVSVKKYMKTLKNEDFEFIAFRKGTKQNIEGYFHQKTVWIITEGQTSFCVRLIIRKNMDGTVKYSFTNMDNEISLAQIAQRQGQRIFVEKIFEEGKNQIGLGDYQTRTWAGFHKHMTLAFLAFFYMAEQKIIHHHQIKLTAPVIRKLVSATIISRWENLDATIIACLQHLKQYQNQIQYNRNKDRGT
jgi:SRSO17 transposase